MINDNHAKTNLITYLTILHSYVRMCVLHIYTCNSYHAFETTYHTDRLMMHIKIHMMMNIQVMLQIKMQITQRYVQILV